MDLEPLQRGVAEFLVVVSATVTTTFTSGLPQKIVVPVSTTTSNVSSQQTVVLPPPSTFREFSNTVVPQSSLNNIQSSDSVLNQSEILGLETTSTSHFMAKKTLTPTPTATATPTPTKQPIASTTVNKVSDYQVPALAVNDNIPSLSSDLIFQMINNHRASINRPAFEKDDKLCQIAQFRAPQLSGEVASGTIHKGFYDMNLPFWATENMAYYQSEQQNMNFWLGSYVHRSAIEGDYKYSCGSCSGNACVQIFTNYLPK